jgi:hypothetical protein
MRYVPVYTAQLANSSERVGSLLALLSTAISNNERKWSERLDRRGQEFLAILAAAALLVALPTFFPNVNAQAIFKLFGDEPIYTSNAGIISLVMLALAFLAFLLWFCVRIWRRRTARSERKQERDRFRGYVKQFWDLADYTTYMYEAERRSKERLPQLPTALYPPPPNCFQKEWDSGRGADNIDSQAISILQELWLSIDSPSQESSTNMQRTRSDAKQQEKDMIAQLRMLRNLIHVFVLRPDLIPLPRTLCILRYKSLQFLEQPTIDYSEFRNSLVYAGFTLNQVKLLQDWLSDPENQKQIRSHSVSVAEVAQALKNAGVTVPPPKDVVNRWHGTLFS